MSAITCGACAGIRVVHASHCEDWRATNTYKIVRYYQSNRAPRVMATGLTLEQAQAHCNRVDTKGAAWFDGYTAE